MWWVGFSPSTDVSTLCVNLHGERVSLKFCNLLSLLSWSLSDLPQGWERSGTLTVHILCLFSAVNRAASRAATMMIRAGSWVLRCGKKGKIKQRRRGWEEKIIGMKSNAVRLYFYHEWELWETGEIGDCQISVLKDWLERHDTHPRGEREQHEETDL